ncbi:hypothetical protein [Bradyrhizobium sp.]|uniref:hypothetical protein n=1 Tax=Bradyrhizobium sp. TaxID=376 RepID=UPI0040379E80
MDIISMALRVGPVTRIMVAIRRPDAATTMRPFSSIEHGFRPRREAIRDIRAGYPDQASVRFFITVLLRGMYR